MRVFQFILFSFIFSSCGHGNNDSPPSIPATLEDVSLCLEDLPNDNGQKSVLIIGDSISLGYMDTVKDKLFKSFQVMHSPCNSRSTRNGVLYIDYWLSTRERWDIITFNFGLWDAKNTVFTSLSDYRERLKIIALKIKAKTNNPIFLTTTFIPENETSRRPGLENELNEVARSLMDELEIEVFDLNLVSLNLIHEMSSGELKNDVHFNEVGSKALGMSIVNEIKILKK